MDYTKFKWVKPINSYTEDYENTIFETTIEQGNEIYHIPTEEDLKNYGMLNIIDYHFDDDNLKSPFDLGNNEAKTLNSFFINVWNYLHSNIAFDNTFSSYYMSVIDLENFLLALSRTKKRFFYYYNTADLEEKLQSLYDFYTNRKNFYDVPYSDRKYGFEKNYSINVYIIKGDEEILLTQRTHGSDITDSENGYIYYIVESDVIVDSFNEVTDGIATLFDLIDSIKKSLESFLQGQYINYFENYFKEYFYKGLVERYRTKLIDDKLEKKMTVDSDEYGAHINLLTYGKLDGKCGNLRAPDICQTTKKNYLSVNKNDDVISRKFYRFSTDTLKIPFYKSEFLNGCLSFFVKKDELPKVFDGIKNYRTVYDYYCALKNEYSTKAKFNKGFDVEYYIYDEETDEITTGQENIYKLACEYINTNISEMVNYKTKELLFSIKPNFNKYVTTNENNTVKEQKRNVLKYVNRDFIVEDFSFGGGNISALTFVDDYLKITVTNDILKNLVISSENPNCLNCGAGYINIQQRITTFSDNIINNFVSNDFNYIKIIKKPNSKEQKTFIYTTDNISDKIDRQKIEEKLKTLNTAETFKIRKNMVGTKEFDTAADDREYSIIHTSKLDIGYDNNYNWVVGHKDGESIISDTVADYKKTIISNNGNLFALDLTELNKYNNVNDITQIDIVDYDSGEKYCFDIVDMLTDVVYIQNNYLEFDTGYDGDRISGNILYTSILNGITEGVLKIDSKPSNNGIVISGDGETIVKGDTLIIGKEYNVSTGSFKVIQGDADEYILILENKNGSVNMINKYEKTETKIAIIKPSKHLPDITSTVKYLNSIPISKGFENGKTVYVTDFNQETYASNTMDIGIKTLNDFYHVS